MERGNTKMLKHINKLSNIPEFVWSRDMPYMLYLFSYADESIKEKIFGVKNCDPDDISWATNALLNIITQNIPSTNQKVYIGIVPIPSRSYLRREKDNDHMLEISKHIKRSFANSNMYNTKIDVLDCLIPLSLSQQKKKSKKDRELQSNTMFTIDPLVCLLINRKKYTYLWIVDDVITTGSTLSAAAKIIVSKINHEKLFILGLAH